MPDSRQHVAALVCGTLHHEYQAFGPYGEMTMSVIEHDDGMQTAVPAGGPGTVVVDAGFLQKLIIDAIAYYGVTVSQDTDSCVPCHLGDGECETHRRAAAQVRDYLDLLGVAGSL